VKAKRHTLHRLHTEPMDPELSTHIRCPKCRQTPTLEDWKSTELLGPLAPHHYQCWVCHFAFEFRPRAGRWPARLILDLDPQL
jgi:hypothetical protein